MRRLMPMWSSLIAVLLLLQWAGAMAACRPDLATATDTAAAFLCHTDGGQPPAPPGQAPAHHQAATCQLCAPLPPIILADPPVPLPPQSPAFLLAAWPGPARASPLPTRLALHQPRAPPTPS